MLRRLGPFLGAWLGHDGGQTRLDVGDMVIAWGSIVARGAFTWMAVWLGQASEEDAGLHTVKTRTAARGPRFGSPV